MYAIPPTPERESRVYLHCRGQITREFDSVEDLCSNLSLSFVEESVGHQYDSPIKIVTKRQSGITYDRETRRIYYRFPEEYFFHAADFIIRTDTGEKLTAEELRPVYWELRSRKWRSRYSRRQGLKSGCCYGRYRHPKTNNERRQAFQNKDENEPPIRARRRSNNIITAWDDRYSHAGKSWKSQSKRKRQYRPV